VSEEGKIPLQKPKGIPIAKSIDYLDFVTIKLPAQVRYFMAPFERRESSRSTLFEFDLCLSELVKRCARIY
jgi:hypothetical protein